MSRPRLAVTLGDPRGIGPEIVAAARADARVRDAADLHVIGPAGLDGVDEVVGDWRPGQRSLAQAGRCAGLAVDRAVELAQAGAVEGIVTAPLDKHALLAGGYDFPGHTELLAARTGRDVAMMLAATRPTAGARLRCAWCSPRPTSRCATCRARLTAKRHRHGGRGHARRPARVVRHRRAAHRALRAQSARGRRRALRTRGRRAARSRGARRRPARVPFRPTPCSCARCAARSTRSSRRITTSA